MGEVIAMPQRPMPPHYAMPQHYMSRGSRDQLSQLQIENILGDLVNEPDWRRRCEDEHNFYDGNQLEVETMKRMREAGIPPLIINMVKPTVNAVLAIEVSSRTDPMVVSETDDSFQGAAALNQMIKEATRLTEFNKATGDAFKDQIVGGVGWVGVSRNSDPFQYQYVVEHIPWREMWWDWRARKPDMSDARFMVRRRWFDQDEVAIFFPHAQEWINYVINDWQSNTFMEGWEYDRFGSDLGRRFYDDQHTTLEEHEWRDSARGRVALYEVLYKVFKQVVAIRLSNGYTMEYQPYSELHQIAVASGKVKVMQGVTHMMRQAFYAGPHMLSDVERPELRSFPYIPFFAYRQDSDLTPYGVIRDMMSPQEEINARRSRLHFDLANNKLVVDEDALTDPKRTRLEWNRPDAFITLNPNRRNLGAEAFRPITNTETSAIQFQLLQEAKGNMREATGVFAELQGLSAGPNQSGAAIRELAEQSQQSMSTNMQNYRYSRRECAERLLNLVEADIGDQEMQVEVEGDMRHARRSIFLNQTQSDGMVNNRVTMLRKHVALSESPSSPTYRSQHFTMLAEITKSLPPEMQGLFADAIVSASELPEKEALAERIRQHVGIGPIPNDPEEREAAQAERDKKAEFEMMIQQLELAERKAKLRNTMAQAQLSMARAGKTGGADTDVAEAQADLLDAQVDEIYNAIKISAQEMTRKNLDTAAQIVEKGANLQRQPQARG